MRLSAATAVEVAPTTEFLVDTRDGRLC